MTPLYTSLYLKGNTIYFRGYDNKNKRISKKFAYKPYLFVNSKNGDTKWRSISGQPMDKITFDSISEAKDFTKSYSDVSGFEIHGMDNWLFQFLHETNKSDIEYYRDRVSIGTIDIEVESEGHFATVDDPDQPITTMVLKKQQYGQTTTYAFGYHEWEGCPDHVIYIQCPDERTLLTKFLNIWNQCDFDIITGWYTDLFDIPYIVNRMKIVLGEEETKRLSPWGIIIESKQTDKKTGRENTTMTLVGIESMDYMRLYQKFVPKKEEQYTLNHILMVLGLEQKVDYEGTLADLYRTDFSKFMRYNLRDVDGIGDIDTKTNLLDQALTIAYDAKIPLQDVFGSVKLWDQIVHSFLMKDHIVVPPMKYRGKDEQYAGAYVKDPIPDRYEWIGSYDYEGLYPSLMIWGNFSPETYRGKLDENLNVDKLLDLQLNNSVQTFLQEKNFALAANLTLWDKDVEGIFSKICRTYKADRKVYKKKMLDAKQQKEKLKASGELTPEKERELSFAITKYDNFQGARKIMLNSLYGAAGNQYFRYYMLELAEAITLSGQFAIQWIEHRLNEFLNEKFQTKNFDYVLYGDTDSAYVTFKPIVDKVFKDKPDASVLKKIEFMNKVSQQFVEPFINETLQHMAVYMNAADHDALVMKREALGDAGIWVGKKNYALSVYDNEGVVYATPDLKIMGMVAVKSSTPKWCRDKMKKAIAIMIAGGKEETIRFISQTKDEFWKLKFQDIANPRSLNGLKKYLDANDTWKSKTPLQVRGAIVHNRLLKELKLSNRYHPIVDGDKIKYCYLTMPNPTFSDVISCIGDLPKEFDLDQYLDYETQYNINFYNPIENIAKVLGWNISTRASLESFFG